MLCALPCPLCRYESIILLAADTCLLTELSNVVAYPCRHSRAEDRQMATPGQPTSYKSEHCELAHNYCLLGATNEVLGDFFGVTSRTIDNWIATHPDFADALHRGRAVADARVVRALFDRACGFSHQVSRTTRYRRQAHTVPNTASYPPATPAHMSSLRNPHRHSS